MKGWLALLSLVAAPVLAQSGSREDPRIHTLRFDGRSSYQIATAPDTNQLLLLDKDDRIVSVVLSDPDAYYVTVSGSGDSIAFKAARETALAMMSVRTEKRSYDLELFSAGKDPAPQVVRFDYAPQASGQVRQAAPPRKLESVSYKTSGSKLLLPASIIDDGEKTYMAWGDNQAIPAVFAVGPSGDEQMVDGYVRGGQFTIDRIYSEFVFRIDKSSATARRQIRRKRAGK